MLRESRQLPDREARDRRRRRETAEGLRYTFTPGRNVAAAMEDLQRTLASLETIALLAHHDIRQRYHRSLLGPYWIVLGTVIFIAGFVLLGSTLFKVDRQYYLSYLVCGVLLWQLIVSMLTEGASMFLADQSRLLSSATPILGILVRTVIRNLIVFAHGAPVALAVCAFNGYLTPLSLLAIPGFTLLILTLAPAALVIGIVATRMRDIQSLVVVALQFLVFFSPVYWIDAAIPTGTPERLLVELNPFFHLLQIVRAPLLSQAPTLENWLVCLTLAAAGWVVAALVFIRLRGRVAFWI